MKIYACGRVFTSVSVDVKVRRSRVGGGFWKRRGEALPKRSAACRVTAIFLAVDVLKPLFLLTIFRGSPFAR